MIQAQIVVVGLPSHPFYPIHFRGHTSRANADDTDVSLAAGELVLDQRGSLTGGLAFDHLQRAAVVGDKKGKGAIAARKELIDRERGLDTSELHAKVIVGRRTVRKLRYRKPVRFASQSIRPHLP